LNLPRSGLVQQALQVDRPPPVLCFATAGSLPATQGQRSKDEWHSLDTALGSITQHQTC